MIFSAQLLKQAPQILAYIQTLGVTFPETIDTDLLLMAFVHKSYAADVVPPLPDNERLEFLGDAVLGQAVCKQLYLDFPTLSEAQLTLGKIFLVKEHTLATVARAIGLPAVILLGKGEERSGGRDKDAILSDCLEAMIGMISLLAGREQAQAFVLRTVYVHLEQEMLFPAKSAKSQLQEYCQQQYKTLPTYTDTIETQESSGNVLAYRTTVTINATVLASAVGSSKKRAQDLAAQEAMKKING